MKTIAEIKKLISEKYYELNHGTNLSNKSFSRFQKAGFKRITFLKEIQFYLETKPNQSFIISEKERVKSIISAKESQYQDWMYKQHFRHVSDRKLKTLFNKENEIPILKKQLKSLNFILNG